MVLSLKFEIEDVKGDIDRLLKELKRPVKACMHGKRMIAYVVVTHEALDELLGRIKQTLDDLNGVDDYWIFPGPNPDYVVGRMGHMSPLAHWLRTGWVENRQFSDAQNMSEPKRRQR
jgi:hypothetical protein